MIKYIIIILLISFSYPTNAERIKPQILLSACDGGKLYKNDSTKKVGKLCGVIVIRDKGSEMTKDGCKNETTYMVATKKLKNNQTAVFFFVNDKLKKIL
jgi:hypothetical protein